jgi:hypothetical protein
MEKRNWHGLMKVLTFQHLGADGTVLFEQKNILNTLHLNGEEYALSVLFAGMAIPTNYYVGLDARAVPAVADTMSSLVNEPTTNGYFRQPVSSTTGFLLQQNGLIWQATSSVVQYVATGGSWGPVTNIWLTTRPDNLGVLVCTSILDQAVTLNSGESILMRIGMALQNC